MEQTIADKLYVFFDTETTGVPRDYKAPTTDTVSVVDEFMDDFDQATFIVGHNIDFDKKILGAELIRLHRPDVMNSKHTYCTMQAGTNFCRIPGRYGYKWPKLQELYVKLFGHDFEGAHNAMSDIEATQECFWELRKKGII